jgi:hypothetical protein
VNLELRICRRNERTTLLYEYMIEDVRKRSKTYKNCIEMILDWIPDARFWILERKK